MKTIIFDLDGTLYRFGNGSYHGSRLERVVLKKAEKYIGARLSKAPDAARLILQEIIGKYREEISLGLETEFGLNRDDYFRTVWDIPARGLVRREKALRETLLKLQEKYRLVLLSDSATAWILNVLRFLEVQDIFQSHIFSGEKDVSKSLLNAFPEIVRRLRTAPADCIVVGDQEATDIIPARSIGMKTVFIHPVRESRVADLNITAVRDLLRHDLG
ncbi:MAG: HAD family hydrolase [Patescibacteria group bacterium]